MNQEQSTSSGSDASSSEATYEVRVTLTVAVPYYDAYPGVGDAMENVMDALRAGGVGILPDRTHYHGGITARVRTAKEIASDKRRAETKRRRSA